MSRQFLKEGFNNVVGLYDQYRPAYTADLFHDIFEYRNIDGSCIAIEIGIGTGQATKPFLDTGAKVIAVELGKDLASFVSDKYGNYGNFEVVNSSFEDFPFPENSADLIYSATAFHWINENEGYRKVYHMLKEGGVFARFANRPFRDKENLVLDSAIQEVYRKYMPENKPGTEFNEEKCVFLANIAKKYGFRSIEYKLYHRIREFTAHGYARLLETYSHTIALEERVRNRFLNEIGEVIEEHGGKIRIFDTLDLQLARK